MGVLKNILEQLDDNVLKALVKWLWPQYKRPRFGYMKNYQVLQRYFISQKILRINGKVPWPADFRSRIVGCENIIKGICCDPGDNPGIYINAMTKMIGNASIKIIKLKFSAVYRWLILNVYGICNL